MVALLTLKHRQIEALLAEVEQRADPEQCGGALNKAASELLLHMAVEEAIFYPAVCRWAAEVLPPSTTVVGDSTHAGLKAALAALRRWAPAEPGFGPACSWLREEVVQHHRAEEASTFRHLAQSMPAAEREAIGHLVAEHERALRASSCAGASVSADPWAFTPSQAAGRGSSSQSCCQGLCSGST